MSAPFDPIELGSHAQDAFTKYLLGANQRGYQRLLQAFAERTDRPKESFIRSKGPYLQGVGSANLSDTPWPDFARGLETEYAPNGLEEEIVESFSDLQFRSLFDHQEAGIEVLTNDRHALISAGTGRGKTEAWFIPIMQYALRAKEGKIDEQPVNGVKAIITYPTKALAQDQLKRFIEYLWLVNTKSDLPEDQYLTIGVFDGDTPTHGIQQEGGKTTLTYLEESFKYFELPESIARELADSEATLNTVSPRVNVVKNNREYYLKARDAYGGERFEFVELTRDKIRRDPPDILLTNPDTINYRMFNINNEKEQHLFIDQPKFLVFDEVHSYQGLFGAHVSLLIKRLRRLREERDVERDLRLVAASATMDRKEEFFQRLFNIPRGGPYEVIEEELKDPTPETGSVPAFLTVDRFAKEELKQDIEEVINSNSPTTYHWVDDLLEAPEQYESSEDYVAAAMDGPLEVVSHLHTVLEDPTNEAYDIADAPRFDDFVDYIAGSYDLDSDTAERVAHNTLVLFSLADQELRVHLFNWPIDGYYKCLHCHKVYTRPQQCDCAGDDVATFVTKIRMDQVTGEHVYEGWYCVECGFVQPVRQETEGEYVYASDPECPHPQHDSPLGRIFWQPEYRCTSCDAISTPDEAIEKCQECGAKLSQTSDGIVCKNPDCCATYQEATYDCHECGGDLDLREGTSVECSSPQCDHDHTESDPDTAILDESESEDEATAIRCTSCNSPLVPRMRLPWVCTDENCSTPHYSSTPPEQCSNTDCSRRTFVLAAYFDTNEADRCSECNRDRSSDVYYVAGTGCRHEGHTSVERVNEPFGLRVAYVDTDRNLRLETPSRASHALPCYHGRSTGFDPLMRGPTNTGVTMSQFMLRRLADQQDDHQQTAKMMSFADSYRDMERLNNDFDEPEKLLFVQQVLLSVLEDEGSLTLSELQDRAREWAERYWNDLDTDRQLIGNRKEDVFTYIEWRGTILGELLRGSYRRFRGTFERASADLVRVGLLDISFEATPSGNGQKTACGELLRNNGQTRDELIDAVRKRNVEAPTEVIRDLEDAGYIRLTGGDPERIHLDEEIVRVHFVGPDHSIPYDPWDDRFKSTASEQVATDDGERSVSFSIPYRDRADIDSSHFNRIAFMVAETTPRFLLSEVYKGDVSAAERRRLEHEFKRNSMPNFLSSGPAMEIGIDIGDLNSLLLHGTPPNTNAYLQRIGRAGRREGRSLVTTVSKRNPIDYFYHKRPDELIESREKPIPLDQHNEQAMKVELTWAVMDYIAANYHIPWKQDKSMEGGYTISDASNWSEYAKDHPREHPPSEYLKFTQVYNAKTSKTDHGRILSILHYIVEGDDAVRAWLEDLLDYSYCRNCDAVFNAKTTGECQICEDETLEYAAIEYGSIIDDVLTEFTDRMARFAYDYYQQLETRRNELEEELRGKNRKIDELDSSDGFFEDSTEGDQQELDRLKRETDRLRDEIQTTRQLEDEYKKMSLSDIHGISDASGFAPQIRSIGSSVAVRRQTKDYESNSVRTEHEQNLARDESMAVRELFPGAYVLRNKRGYVVTQVKTDTDGTRRLRDRLGERVRCNACGYTEQADDQTHCEQCGAPATRLEKITPVAIQEATMTQSDIRKDNHGKEAKDVYPFADYNTRPESTYPNVESEIDNLDVDRGGIGLTDGDGTILFKIVHGDLRITETVDAFTTRYSNGQQDPAPQPIKVCRAPDCNGVVIRNRDGHDQCFVDPSHDTDDQELVEIGRSFSTKGLEVRAVADSVTEPVLHTFVHGLRLALQRIGGVGIRSIRESYDHPSRVGYVFEDSIGGNGVTQLLLNQDDGEYIEVQDALDVMTGNIGGCNCDYGCPECIHQYGCDVQNREPTLDKRDTLEILEQIDAVVPVSLTDGDGTEASNRGGPH